MNRRSLITSTLLAAAAGLSACASGPRVSMNAADRAAIRLVAVSADIKPPTRFSYQERGAGVGALFGVAGALAEASARPAAPAGEAGQMLALLESNQIVVQEIVRAEFIRAANARGGMRFVEAAGEADAELFLAIDMFGFGRTHLLGTQLHPIFNATATMKRRDGSVVWQKSEFITAVSPDAAVAFTLDEYRQNPARLREALGNSAAGLMKHLTGALP
jgi:hypothetical protein